MSSSQNLLNSRRSVIVVLVAFGFLAAVAIPAVAVTQWMSPIVRDGTPDTVTFSGPCKIEYQGNFSQDYAKTRYISGICNQYAHRVGAREWFQPAAPVVEQTTVIFWGKSYAETTVNLQVTGAKGYWYQP